MLGERREHRLRRRRCVAAAPSLDVNHHRNLRLFRRRVAVEKSVRARHARALPTFRSCLRFSFHRHVLHVPCQSPPSLRVPPAPAHRHPPFAAAAHAQRQFAIRLEQLERRHLHAPMPQRLELHFFARARALDSPSRFAFRQAGRPNRIPAGDRAARLHLHRSAPPPAPRTNCTNTRWPRSHRAASRLPDAGNPCAPPPIHSGRWHKSFFCGSSRPDSSSVISTNGFTDDPGVSSRCAATSIPRAAIIFPDSTSTDDDRGGRPASHARSPAAVPPPARDPPASRRQIATARCCPPASAASEQHEHRRAFQMLSYSSLYVHQFFASGVSATERADAQYRQAPRIVKACLSPEFLWPVPRRSRLMNGDGDGGSGAAEGVCGVERIGGRLRRRHR